MISRRQLFLVQKGRCFYCSGSLSPWGWEKQHPQGHTVDHFFPKLRKIPDSHKEYNKVLSCIACNNKKGSRDPSPREIEKHKELHKQLGVKL